MHKEFMKYLLSINRFECRNLILAKKDKMNVIENIIIPALTEIGDGWQEGIYSLSQIYMSSVICEDISEELFAAGDAVQNQKLNIAVVTFDDYHTFGKKLVSLTLRASGYRIHDFGMIFDENKLLELVKKNNIDVLLMSVLMLPPALKIKDIKPKLLEINPDLKIIVGGAPFRFDEQLYLEVGGDATGDTPQDAVRLIKEMEGAL